MVKLYKQNLTTSTKLCVVCYSMHDTLKRRGKHILGFFKKKTKPTTKQEYFVISKLSYWFVYF